MLILHQPRNQRERDALARVGARDIVPQGRSDVYICVLTGDETLLPHTGTQAGRTASDRTHGAINAECDLFRRVQVIVKCMKHTMPAMALSIRTAIRRWARERDLLLTVRGQQALSDIEGRHLPDPGRGMFRAHPPSGRARTEIFPDRWFFSSDEEEIPEAAAP